MSNNGLQYVTEEKMYPIVVDLDGTLTLTDTLLESVIRLIKQSPWVILIMPFWIFQGRSVFKDEVAKRITLPVNLLPYRLDLIHYLSEKKKQGREIILATAAHYSIANSIAEHLGLFSCVLASNATQNLKGINKLVDIQRNVGSEFVYAGNSHADLVVWRGAKAAILAGVSSSVACVAKKTVAIEHEFFNVPSGLGEWLRALRVHQWTKNLLLFIPLLSSFAFFDQKAVYTTFLAFVAFSVAASSTYILNDLWDLDNDRAHVRKCKRPFASANLSILMGLMVATVGLLLALVLAYFVSEAFFLMLWLYLFLTSVYSWILKVYVLMDVLMLSLLYTLRIVAGSVAAGVVTSSWLLAFSVFIFFSLALVKRCAELVTLQQNGKDATFGRDYRISDLTILWPLGVAAGVAAIVVFGLFISAPETKIRYATPDMLWLVAIILIYWIARLWIKTSRGEMHDDPIVYAIKDGASRIAVVVMVMVLLLAHFVNFSLWL